jgi:hypothetical protein
MFPAMTDALAPVTRLNVTELAFGWTKVVVSFLPIENVFQLIAALLLDWLIVSWVGLLCVMVAEPPITWPFCGNAKALGTIETDPSRLMTNSMVECFM